MDNVSCCFGLHISWINITLGLITGTFLSAFNNSDKIPGVPDALLIAALLDWQLLFSFRYFFFFVFQNILQKLFQLSTERNCIKLSNISKLFCLYRNSSDMLISVYIAVLLAGTSSAFIQRPLILLKHNNS